jgi:hypothetical protein
MFLKYINEKDKDLFPYGVYILVCGYMGCGIGMERK